MVAPLIRRDNLGAWTAGQTKTGSLAMDLANGYVIKSVELFGHGTAYLQWNEQAQVGEGGTPAGGVIPVQGAGAYAPSAITGTINETTGAWSITDNHQGALSSYANNSIQFRCEHPTLGQDWYVHVAGENSTKRTPRIKRVPHSGLSNPVTQHGLDCLGLVNLDSYTQASYIALLKDPQFYTDRAHMSQALMRYEAWAEAPLGLIHRAQDIQAASQNGKFYAMGKSQWFSDYRFGLKASNDVLAKVPVGLNDDVPTVLPATDGVTIASQSVEAFAQYAGGTPAGIPADRWQWHRLISTIEDGNVHLQLMISTVADADNLDPTFYTVLHAWHTVGSNAITGSIGEFGGTWGVNGNWYYATPFGIPPNHGMVGFYLANQSGGAIYKNYIDSFRAWVMG